MSALFAELTLKPPHSGHPLQQTPLINGLFSEERMKLRSNSHNKTSMQRTLYSEHLSTVDIIFCSQITLPPRILDSGDVQYDVFLAEMCIHFTFDNILFKFSSIFVILLFKQFLLFYFLSSFLLFYFFRSFLLFYFLRSFLLFYSLSRLFQVHENVAISNQYSSLWLTCVPVAKMSKAVGQRQKYGCNNGNFCYIWTITSPLQ